MLLPCTQKRRQTVVAARQPLGRVPHSAPLLGLWRLLRHSRAPAGSATRLEGPPAGAAAGAGAGGGGSTEPRMLHQTPQRGAVTPVVAVMLSVVDALHDAVAFGAFEHVQRPQTDLE